MAKEIKMNLTKDELLNCIIATFKQYNVSNIDTITGTDSVRFSLSGHKLRVSARGFVESVNGDLLACDLVSNLVSQLLAPAISTASNLKLAS